MPVDPEYLSLVYPGPMPAFLYGRVSFDPLKRGSSVEDQLEGGQELCDRHGWPVQGVFKDVSISASRYRIKERDEFDRMIDGILARECRIVVAFEASRYYRDLEAYLRLRNACTEAGVLLCYDGQVYDLSKRADRKATARDALEAEDEAESTRERNARTARKRTSAGKPHGPAPYGYRRRYDSDTGELIDQVPDDDQAEVVREVFKRVAAGDSEYAIRVDLNARGVPSPSYRGSPWSEQNLQVMLRNRAYIGERTHFGRTVAQATWKPIVDLALWNAVQDIVNAPTRASTSSREIVHLLSGIARCGPCDQDGVRSLVRTVKHRSGNRAYGCKANESPRRFCVTVSEPLLDAFVVEGLLAWLGSPQLVTAFRADDSGEVTAAAARAKALRQQLDEARELAAKFGPDGVPQLSVASLAAMEAALMPQIAAADSVAVPRELPPVLVPFVDAEDVERVWGELDINQRRSVVRAAVTVRVWKAGSKGARTLRPGRVTLAFAGQPGFVPLLRGKDGVLASVS